MTELTPDLSGEWRIDPDHSRIGFSTRHAMVTKVRGAFNEVEGILNVDAENPMNSTARVRVRVDSIDTRNAQRDEHLRTNDFFDAPNHPEITFDSTHVDQIEEGNFIVAGSLTIRGVTQDVSLPIEFLGVERDAFGSLRAGFEGSRRIDRQQFGVRWNTALDSGGLMVSDKITLEFEISAVKVES